MAKTQYETGIIGWADLTVPDADTIRDFYAKVVGWNFDPVSMGSYDDYCMKDSRDEAAAGICHSRGANAGLPAVWLIYVTVKDLDASVQTCERLGGKVVTQPRNMEGSGRYCVVEDPVGAVVALFEPSVSPDA